MKKINRLGTAMVLVLIAFLLAMNGMRRRDEALASRLAPEVLRFHVLANSDSAEDQALKLAVKDYLLEEIRLELASETGADSGLEENSGIRADDAADSVTPLTKDMVAQYILDNKSALEAEAEAFIRTCDFDYPVDIRLETCEFPLRTYGDMTFPSGMYDAVRVLIGDGAGKNFWCVLYPSLCYLDGAYAVVPDESKAILQAVLPEDDFQALLSARRSAGIRLKDSSQNGSGKSAVMNTEKKEQDSLLPQVSFRFKFLDIWKLKTDL